MPAGTPHSQANFVDDSGGALRRGHLMMVTMAADGPVFANIRLDAIADQRGEVDPILQLYRWRTDAS